jgi:hypothetical protein
MCLCRKLVEPALLQGFRWSKFLIFSDLGRLKKSLIEDGTQGKIPEANKRGWSRSIRGLLG